MNPGTSFAGLRRCGVDTVRRLSRDWLADDLYVVYGTGFEVFQETMREKKQKRGVRMCLGIRQAVVLFRYQPLQAKPRKT